MGWQNTQNLDKMQAYIANNSTNHTKQMTKNKKQKKGISSSVPATNGSFNCGGGWATYTNVAYVRPWIDEQIAIKTGNPNSNQNICCVARSDDYPLFWRNLCHTFQSRFPNIVKSILCRTFSKTCLTYYC